MLGGDELEVYGVHDRPDLPRSLAGRKKIVLDLASNSGEGVAIDQTEVSEEDSHEARAPEELVNSDLEGNIFGFLALDQVVEPVVEVMSRGSVVDETKEGKREETLHVEGSSGNEELYKARKKHDMV